MERETKQKMEIVLNQVWSQVGSQVGRPIIELIKNEYGRRGYDQNGRGWSSALSGDLLGRSMRSQLLSRVNWNVEFKVNLEIQSDVWKIAGWKVKDEIINSIHKTYSKARAL